MNGKLPGHLYGLFLAPGITGSAALRPLGFDDVTTNELSTAMRRALKRADDGKTLDPTEVEVLLTATGPALTALMATAARVRDQGLADAGRPGIITYSKKVFIPLTKLCRDVCHYCTFAETPKQGRASYLTVDQAVSIAQEGKRAGCNEALFTLGERPELRYPIAKRELESLGFGDTLSYLGRAQTVLNLTS